MAVHKKKPMIVAVASTLQGQIPLLVVENSGAFALAVGKSTNFTLGQLEVGPTITGPYFADPHSTRVVMLIAGTWNWIDMTLGTVDPITGIPADATVVAIDGQGAVYWTIRRGNQHWLIRSSDGLTTQLIWTPLPIYRVFVNSEGMVGIVTNHPSPPFERCTVVIKRTGKLVCVCQVDGIAWSDNRRLWGAVRGTHHLQATEFDLHDGAVTQIHTDHSDLAIDVPYQSGPPDIFVIKRFTTLPVSRPFSEIHHHWRGRGSTAIVSSLCVEINIVNEVSELAKKSVNRTWQLADGKRIIHGLEVGSGSSLVIYLLGGPGDPLLDRYSPIISCLVHSGRTVWVPSLSGYGGQSIQHRQAIYANWGHKERFEIESMLIIAVREGYASVNIIGHSYGAYLALQMHDPRVRSVVAWAPFVDPDSLWQEVPSSRVLLHQWGLGSQETRRRSLGPYSQADDGHLPPTLFITGTQDVDTPLTPSLRNEIDKRRSTRGTTHVTLPIAHTAFRPSEAEMVGQEILDFLDAID